MKKIISVFIVLMFVFQFMLNDACVVSAEEITETSVSFGSEISAKAYVLMDGNTGTVLASLNENEKLYPASVTKIMTILLVCEAIECGKMTLDMEITCSESAAEKGGSQIWLEPGEVMTVHDLLKACVVYSANDACCLLGEVISGDENAFCELMNKKALELGMNNTNFDNCTGLDDDTDTHKTTAYDIAIMSRELLKHDFIKDYTSIWMDTLRNGETQLVNTNKLIRTYPGATGLKTGTTTKAGCCVSATAERDGLELIAVVLGAGNSKERFSGAKTLLDWGFANFEIITPDTNGKFSSEIKVTHGVDPTVKIRSEKCSQVLVEKGSVDKISYEVNIPESIAAPVKEGQVIGEIIIRADSEIIEKCSIISEENVEEMTFLNALKALIFSMQKNM